MKIRIMTIEDFNSMYLLWQEAGLGLVDFKTEGEYATQILKLNPSSNFVALEGRKIIGTIFGTFNGKRGWIYHLAVHPAFQKRGLGSLLLQKAEQALKKMGAKRALVGVDKPNLKAMKFYKKCGYTKVDGAIFLGKNL